MSAMADILTGQNNYPAKSLNAAWEKMLLNQFHDILPGSSIRQVYEDSQHDYAEIGEFGKRAIQQAQKTILERIVTSKDSLVVFNPLGFERDEVIELPWRDELAGKTIIDPQGKASPTQPVEHSGIRKLLCLAPKIPAMGYQVYKFTPLPASYVENNELVISPDLMENRFYRVVLNAQGQISSIYDKEHKREVLHAGANANVFQAFEDKPMNFDAWDIDLYYQEKKTEIDKLVEAAVEESGPIRGTLRLTWQFGDSTITQRIVMYASARRIDFPTEVEWHQQQTLLKVAFPVEIRASRATYNIQFGSIERPTHWNTSWDWARFEVCAHQWADLSEGNYGVALLNDCKYGYDIKDNVMRLTLIKSAISPDAQADKGHHEFTYSLLPHAGEWRESELNEEAYALNNPAWGVYVPVNSAGELPDAYNFATLDAGHVIIETIKQAEDDQAWIVRLYESKQYRNHDVHLDFGVPIRKAVECNLVEDGSDPVSYEGSRITFSISPAEIKTFKVWF
jgi:alpha-mannosidase